MALWLFKTEPDDYSYSDLRREGEAIWDGITNAAALKHLRSVRVGDRVLLYHTGKEKSVVGEIRIISVEADPLAVRVAPLTEWTKPVTLKQIKAEETLARCALARLPRLSVVPVSEEEWKRIEALSK